MVVAVLAGTGECGGCGGSGEALPCMTVMGERGGGSLEEETGHWVSARLILLTVLSGKKRLLDGLLGMSGNS